MVVCSIMYWSTSALVDRLILLPTCHSCYLCQGFHCEYRIYFRRPHWIWFSYKCYANDVWYHPSCFNAARRGQMHMNSTTVSTWGVMEANSLFGIGYFERKGHMRSGKNAFREYIPTLSRKIWICMREVGSWNNKVSPFCTYVSTWSRTRVPPCLSEQVTYLHEQKYNTTKKYKINTNITRHFIVVEGLA